MSNETIVVVGTTKSLETSGGTISNASVVQAAIASYGIVADGGSYPDAEFVLGFTFGTAPTEGTVLALYARPMSIDGSNNAEVPEATRPTEFIGSFVVNNVTTAQYARLLVRDVPLIANYYIHNNGTGQSVTSGWTLKVTPRTYKPAP